MTNFTELKKLYAKDSTAKPVIATLASRNRWRATTDLRRLHTEVNAEHGLRIPGDNFKAFFKKLQDIGLGKYVEADGMDPPRFEWKKGVHYTEFARELAPDAKPVNQRVSILTPGMPEPAPGSKPYPILTSKGFVYFHGPKGLPKKDLARVVEAITLLAE